MPEVFSFIQEIEEPSQKCDLCKKVMKIFADELDKDDVSFQNFVLFISYTKCQMFMRIKGILYFKMIQMIGFFFYICLRIIHGIFILFV